MLVLPGCVIPGATLGSEALQVRFAEGARRAVEAEERSSVIVPVEGPVRSAESEAEVILAGGELGL